MSTRNIINRVAVAPMTVHGTTPCITWTMRSTTSGARFARLCALHAPRRKPAALVNIWLFKSCVISSLAHSGFKIIVISLQNLFISVVLLSLKTRTLCIDLFDRPINVFLSYQLFIILGTLLVLFV